MAAILAILGCVWLWLGRRDWRAALILVGVAADILPWLPYPDRTKFSFYALPMLPFLILGAVRDGRPRARQPHRHRSETAVGSACPSAATPCSSSSAFAYFYPIWTYVRIPYNAWHDQDLVPRLVLATGR